MDSISIFLDKLTKHCNTMTEKPISNLFESAETSRILLEMHCEAASETLEEEVSAMTLSKKYFDYTNVIDNGALHDKNFDKFISSNNSAEWTTKFRTLDLIKYINPSVINIEEDFEAFRKIFSNKTRYVHKEDLPLNVHKDYSTITNTNKIVVDHPKQNNNYKKDQSLRTNSSEFPRRNSRELNVESSEAPVNPFKTAREELHLQNIKRNNPANGSAAGIENPSKRKRLGNTRMYVGNKFVSPMISNNDSGDDSGKSQEFLEEIIDERLKNIDPKMVELIRSEIMDSGPSIDWCDIAGLDFAKSSIQEAVVWPMLRPDIFTGLRRPPKGILLFGPPGTGKTLIGKCVASQSQSTFFSISASSLTSKWIGDGEKMVRALFAVARCHQPAVIFIDEIDSLLQQRSETEHEASRRMKTEFLIQLDGATTDSNERLLLIGATNRPQELDEAARRRFVKRLYIPLPEFEARKQLVNSLMSKEKHSLSEQDLKKIAELSDGYSGADMKNLCCDASMGPIRSISLSQIQSIEAQEVRPVSVVDFTSSLNRVRPSVSTKDLDQYIVWNKTYGSGMF